MQKDKRRRTLILSIFFSAFGPFVTGYALFMNTAVTQLADFVRRTAELGVLVLALVVYMMLKREMDDASQKRWVRTIYHVSGGVLILSGVFLLGMFLRGLFIVEIPTGDVRLGLAVATLGILFNGGFFIRYTLFPRRKAHAVMDTQRKLYQAKTFVDVSVVVALASVWLFEASQGSYYIDQAGTIIVSVYLLVRGARMIRTA